MHMLKLAVIAGLGLAIYATAPVAQAQSTVECQSRDYQYDECWAGFLRAPQLVHQISNSACIVNRSWGYNRRSGYIWVANGCAGVFADVNGYHHGRGDTYDPGARRYSERSGQQVPGAREVVALAIAGDPDAAAVWDSALDALAFALAQIASTIAPEAIVIGGGLSRAGAALFDPLASRLDARLSYQRRPRLVPAQLGAEAGLLGAALLAREQVAL